MQLRYLLIFMFAASSFLNLHASVPLNDTISLEMEHIEGRWLEESENSIYIFRDDYTFHKGSNSGELLFFNIAGKYQLSNDSIIILYQDFSRGTNSNTKVRRRKLQVIALSDEELNINQTENNRTKFIRLRRQNRQ